MNTKTQKKILLAFLVMFLVAAICFAVIPFGITAVATGSKSTDPNVVDFTTKMSLDKWQWAPFGSSEENTANRPAVELVDDNGVSAIKIPNDNGVNWSQGTLTLLTDGYNNIEYKFRVKLDGEAYSSLLGQISLFSTGTPARWGNNGEYGNGLYALFYDGHTVVLGYRNAQTGNSFGEEIGRVTFHSNELKDSYFNFSVKLTESDEGTYATVRVQDLEVVNNYYLKGVTGKGKFGIVSGNADADIYIAPYNYYSEGGLTSDRTPAIEGDNMQDFINKGYPSTAWAGSGSSSVIENGIWKITANNGITARLGVQHYSTAISDTSYNFRVKVDKGEGDPNYGSHAVSFMQRVTGDTGSGQITSAYGIWFHSDNLARLYRYKDNRDGTTQLGDNMSLNLYDGNVHDISFATKNVEDGVLITFYFDGEKKLEYTDISDAKITTKGQFVVDSHFGSDVYNISGYTFERPYLTDSGEYVVGSNVPQEEWVTATTVLNIIDLIEESAESAWIIKNGSVEKVASVDGGEKDIVRVSAGDDANNSSIYYYAGAGARQFQDYTMSFKMKQTYKPNSSGWGSMITLRDSAPGSGNWDPAKPTGYDILAFNNRVCLRKITNGASEISGTSYSANLIDGQFHEWAITILNQDDGVRIVTYIDGVLVFDYLDTENPNTDSGYVSFLLGESLATTDFMVGCLEHNVEKDTEAPVITVPDSKPTIGVVGEEISLPVGTLTDNVTDPALMTITRKVVGPDGQDVTVTNRKFTPVVEGTYVVTYTAIDDEGNEGVATWNIVVTKSNNQGGNTEKSGGCGSNIFSQNAIILAVVLTIAAVSVIIVARGRCKNNVK